MIGVRAKLVSVSAKVISVRAKVISVRAKMISVRVKVISAQSYNHPVYKSRFKNIFILLFVDTRNKGQSARTSVINAFFELMYV